jgi:hypothetical protein
MRLNRAKWYVARRMSNGEVEVFVGPLDTKRECWGHFGFHSPYGAGTYRGVQIEDSVIVDRREDYNALFQKPVPATD